MCDRKSSRRHRGKTESSSSRASEAAQGGSESPAVPGEGEGGRRGVSMFPQFCKSGNVWNVKALVPKSGKKWIFLNLTSFYYTLIIFLTNSWKFRNKKRII